MIARVALAGLLLALAGAPLVVATACSECANFRDCAEGQLCIDGLCKTQESACQSDDVCPLGQRCLGHGCGRVFVRCAAGCRVGEVCTGGHCVAAAGSCLDDDDCASDPGTICDFNECAEPDECAAPEDCEPGHVCEQGVCEEDLEHPPCSDAEDCGDDQFCEGLECVDR